MMRGVHSPDLADLLNQHQYQLDKIVSNSWKRRTLHAIRKCRTSALGGHIDQCTHSSCGKLHISYNSCRNRHCPKCQGHLQEQWIQAREAELINTAYYHMVFTIPQVLNELSLSDPKGVYNTLFKAAWQTLKVFAADKKFLGAEPGMIAVLHTWGQNLSLHPHLHCIVPAGGLTKAGYWRKAKGKGKFLFPVKAMSTVFRAKFIEELRKKHTLSANISVQLFSKPWVIYAKRPFYGPKQVIEYLGRYTHKIAISNTRILSLKGGTISFSVKNYRKAGKKEIRTLTHKEFIRRFALHILPKGFVRIRHYGILSSCRKKINLEKIRAQLPSLSTEAPQRIMHRVCPVCKKGALITLLRFDARGPPKNWKTMIAIIP